ncbi:MAG: hypothetical protein LC722_09155 [Actinobacteria bacterium]|nr:hypothetical protein [Actinomycetota bacterium]
MTETKTKVRLSVLGALIAFLFVSLSTRLWYLQVLAQEEFAARAKNNSVRIVPIVAARGRILDRTGHELVRNRTSTILYVDRTVLKGEERTRVVAELSDILKIKVEELNVRLDDLRYYAFQPVPVAFDVDKAAAMYIAEHDEEFPGVKIRVGPVRLYPNKSLGAHFLGYTGEISAEELKLGRFKDYDQGALIGKAGVERVYEEDLQGLVGLENYEVNAQGKILRALATREPSPGDDLVLSIDLEAQRITEDSLRRGIRLAQNTVDEDSGEYLNAGGGAAVVMDPRNGQILAMASFPTFDPSNFIGGITQRDYARLTAEGRNFPLLDRAVQSSYPPGSTFKPFVALAAMKEGLANTRDYYPCPASYSLPNDPSGTEFDNWKSVNSPPLTVAGALVESCDTVFYDFGYRFYQKRVLKGEVFQDRLAELRLGMPTGVDLPSEEEGRIPDVEYGTLTRRIEPQVMGHFPQSKQTIAYIREGLKGVVRYGTAAGAFAGYPMDRFPIAGKTGTSEIDPKQPYSWFAAMSLVPGKPYVVVAIVEEGGHGSTTAAPLVRRIYEGLFGIDVTGELVAGGNLD